MALSKPLEQNETMRLLVIEDNPKMAALIQKGLTEQGYAVDVAHSGHEGEFMAASEAYDAVMLDLMLPDEDGLIVCRNLRRRGVHTPILMLTALSTTQDKVTGLDAGADDYLAKPFEFDELVARIRALLRRGQAREASTLKFEDIELDLLKRTVTRAGQKIKLTAKEFALLEYFLRNPNRVLSRTAIGEHVWDMNFEPESNVIDVYVSMLRRRIDKGYDRQLIHTMIGAGYMLSTEPPTE
ncbi:MAG TPA: response regulator transcription factor [Phycisphaerae bacterium]|nr:response regulator transcription factor [Phycisphaerae bacterium]